MRKAANVHDRRQSSIANLGHKEVESEELKLKMEFRRVNSKAKMQSTNVIRNTIEMQNAYYAQV